MLSRTIAVLILAGAMCFATGCGGGGGSSSSSGIIQGTVLGTGGASATVTLDASTTTTTDAQTGAYQFTGVSQGSHTLDVDLEGYYSQSQSCSVGSGETVTVDFTLITDDGQTLLLSVPDRAASAGSTFTVPIVVSNAEGVAGFDVVLAYNSDLLTATSAAVTSLTSDFMMQYNVTSGRIAISMAKATGAISGSGALVNITFTVNPDATVGESSSLRMVTHTLYDESVEALAHLVDHGVFTVN